MIQSLLARCRATFLALALLAAFSAPASAESVARALSPDGAIEVALEIDADGRPGYTIARQGQTIVSYSRLGFLLTDAPKLERGMALIAQSQRSVDDTWEQPWGERRFVRNRYNELRATLEERDGLRRRMVVVFRAFDDGVGFRYELPEQANMRQARIGQELTEFNIAQPGQAWWLPGFEWNRAEYLYNATPISAVSVSQTPVTMRFESGLHVSIHEAALVDYAGMNLRRAEGQAFRAALTPGADGPAVVRDLPFATPWRTLTIASSAAGLAQSSIILNLNEPNAIGDVSWFRPMKYVGVWWEMHLGRKTWSSGPNHGATTENAIRHIDFAARNGLGGVLIEGWNLGWDGNWFASGADFNFTRAYPDFDLERVAAHARRRGVQIIGHHETGGNIAVYEPQLEDAMALYERLGIHSVKTGYVADAGGIQAAGPGGAPRFIWHESQEMARHHLRVVQTAARHRIAVNPHEPIKDTGLRRTYPNWIAREGARGAEYDAWGNPGNPPEHVPNLIFTRLLAGPMDYTPGLFGMNTQSPNGVQTTMAKQLAFYVVIYSPIQMAADLLENYEANPGPFQFIRDVPVDWEETRVLNGEIGDFATIARKERGGRDWYLGAVTDENARSIDIALEFLEPGRRYRAHIYADGPNADYRSARNDIAISSRIVTSRDRLSLRLAPGGGQAIRFQAL